MFCFSALFGSRAIYTKYVYDKNKKCDGLSGKVLTQVKIAARQMVSGIEKYGISRFVSCFFNIGSVSL